MPWVKTRLSASSKEETDKPAASSDALLIRIPLERRVKEVCRAEEL